MFIPIGCFDGEEFFDCPMGWLNSCDYGFYNIRSEESQAYNTANIGCRGDITEEIEAIDLFDRVQLAGVLEICQNANSLSAAGRTLFANTRTKRTSNNDADRLRKYLSRFNITWKMIKH